MEANRVDLQCRVDDAKGIVCWFTSSNKSVSVEHRVVGDIHVIQYDLGRLCPYTIEFETPINYRVLCNGEFYGELAWGSKRVSQWSTLNNVEFINCIIGEYNILEYEPFIIAYRGRNIDSYREDIECLREKYYLWRILSKQKIYKVYELVLLDKKLGILEPPLAYPELKSFVNNLVYSTFTILGVKLSKKHRLIEELSSSLIEEEPLIPLDRVGYIIDMLERGRLSINHLDCIKTISRREIITIENKCCRTCLLFMKGVKGRIILYINAGERIDIPLNIVGDSYRYIALLID